MLHNSIFSYFCGHETHRKPRSAREAKIESHRVVKTRKVQSPGCSDAWDFPHVRPSLAPGTSIQWQEWDKAPSHPRSSVPVDGATKAEVRQAPATRGIGPRIFDRSVDAGTYRTVNPSAVWYCVSPQSCMAYSALLRLELPKAGAQSTSAKGGRDREVEAVPLAAYKKTLKSLVPTWCLKMRAGSCSLLMSAEPGRPKEKPLMYTTGLSKTKYLLSGRFPFRPFIKRCGSLFASEAEISPVAMLSSFFLIYSTTYRAIFSFFGMEAPSIRANLLQRSFISTPAFTRKDSRLMPRNLIRWNTSGARQMLPCLTEHLLISQSYRLNYISILAEYGRRNSCSGRVFMQAGSNYFNEHV